MWEVSSSPPTHQDLSILKSHSRPCGTWGYRKSIFHISRICILQILHFQSVFGWRKSTYKWTSTVHTCGCSRVNCNYVWLPLFHWWENEGHACPVVKKQSWEANPIWFHSPSFHLLGCNLQKYSRTISHHNKTPRTSQSPTAPCHSPSGLRMGNLGSGSTAVRDKENKSGGKKQSQKTTFTLFLLERPMALKEGRTQDQPWFI